MNTLGLSNSTLSSNEDAQTQWMSLSDLMAALMMVFMLISISMMRQSSIEQERVRDIAESWQDTRAEIYAALNDEFQMDLAGWDATLDSDNLELTFWSPDVLFPTGKQRLTRRYKEILADFFPRYMGALGPFRPSINEIRIEGHTSSEWGMFSSLDDAYFENMKLSQGRTRSVLRYVYNLDASLMHANWIRESVAAVGLSSSKAIRRGGVEDKDASRRVTFRIVTNAEEKIQKIVEEQ